MHKQRGFTLIELLVVITIIGVLSMIGLTSYRGANQKARDSRRAVDVQQIRSSLEMYKTDNGVYPSSLGSGMNTYFAEGKVPQPPTSQTGDVYNYHALPDGCSDDCSGYEITYTLEASKVADEDEVVLRNP